MKFIQKFFRNIISKEKKEENSPVIRKAVPQPKVEEALGGIDLLDDGTELQNAIQSNDTGPNPETIKVTKKPGRPKGSANKNTASVKKTPSKKTPPKKKG